MFRASKAGLFLAILIAAGTAGFGVRAVWTFSKQSPRIQSQVQTPARVIENPYSPEFVATSDDERGVLNQSLESAAYRALLEIDAPHRPNEASARAIAAVFAEFVTVCRTGTPEDHVAMVESRGREPDKRFLVSERKDRFWKSNTGWAREAPLGIDGVWARPRAIRGNEIPVDPSRIRSGGGNIRHFSNGKLPFNDAHDRTIYEIILPATLAAVDGTREQGAVGVLISNDAPNGGWDTLGTFSHGVPQGFIIFLTPP